ncbi:MAG TPA: hypothetical protein VFG77_07040 [Nitrososphaeraceae archaeon]|nr:hypothetical protein [Nitrososphaeraceae archaeon]
MSDNKELLTIAVIAAALMMVLGTSIPSNVLASSSIEAAEPSDDNGNDDTSNSDDGSSGNDDNANDNSADDSGNSNGNSGSENDEESDDGSGDNDSSDSSNNDGGVPEDYLGEYSTCVSDLSSDDSILSQDDVVDCYGQVFGPNPTHDLGPLMQNAPTSPASNMPGFENMPSALQQPGDQQQQMQPLSQTQPQDGQQQPIQQQQQQPQTGLGNQQQMSPTELPIDAGILDVETIKEIVKNRLAQ